MQLTPREAVDGRYSGILEADVTFASGSNSGYIELPSFGSWEDRTKYEGWLSEPGVIPAIDAAVAALDRPWWSQFQLWQRAQAARREINDCLRYTRGALDSYLRAAAILQMTTMDELGHALFLNELPHHPEAEQVLREADLLGDEVHRQLCSVLGLPVDAPHGRLWHPKDDVFAEPYVIPPARTELPLPWTAVPVELDGGPAFAALIGPTRSLRIYLPMQPGERLAMPAGAVEWVVWQPGQRLLFDALHGEWHPPSDLVKVWPVHAQHPQAAQAEQVVRERVLPGTSFEEHFAVMRAAEAAYVAGGLYGLRHRLHQAARVVQEAAADAPEELLRPIAEYVHAESDRLSR